MDQLEQQQSARRRASGGDGVVVAGGPAGAAVGGKVGGTLGAGAATAVGGGGRGRGDGGQEARLRRARGAVGGMLNRDPRTITKADVDAIGTKFGMSDMARQCPEGVTELYDAYLMSVIPMGDAPVQGWEPAALKAFREQVGLEDADAANAHIEVGRRLFRKRIELGDKDADLESRREFQKLVFISTRTFGEAQAKFLLP